MAAPGISPPLAECLLERPLCEHLSEVLTELGARAVVARWARALGGLLGGLRRIGARRERLLDAPGPQGDRPHVRQRDVRAAVHAHRSHADRRPVLGPTVELLVRPATGSGLRDADLAEDLLRVERGLEEAAEALGDRQPALAL